MAETAFMQSLGKSSQSLRNAKASFSKNPNKGLAQEQVITGNLSHKCPNGNQKRKGLPPIERVLNLCQVKLDAQMDFVTTNRVVAVIEKALERLQLLNLLDDTVHRDKDAEEKTNVDTEAMAPSKTFSLLFHVSTPKVTPSRGAVVFSDSINLPVNATEMHKTYFAVTAVLSAAANTAHGGRPTVAQLLSEQQRLEARYEDILRAARLPRVSFSDSALCTHHGFDGSNNSEQAALHLELKRVSAKLREHRQHLCTQLKDNPNDEDNWRKIVNGRQELFALLRNTVAELTTGYEESMYHPNGSATNRRQKADLSGLDASTSRLPSLACITSIGSLPSSGTAIGAFSDTRTESHNSQAQQSHSMNMTLSKRFGSMVQMHRAVKSSTNHPRIPLTSAFVDFKQKVLQEQAAQRWANLLVKKQMELNQNVKQLQSDMLQERSHKEREVAERRAKIAELRTKLREKKRALKQRSVEAKASVEAAMEGQHRQADEEQIGLTTTMKNNQYLLKMEENTHEVFAQFLQERAQELETMAYDWSRKNQTELKRMEVKKIDAEQMRQQCSERLQECEIAVKTHLDMQAQRHEQRQQEENTAMRIEQQQQMAYGAASILQSAVRAMLTRHALEKLKKTATRRKKK